MIQNFLVAELSFHHSVAVDNSAVFLHNCQVTTSRKVPGSQSFQVLTRSLIGQFNFGYLLLFFVDDPDFHITLVGE